MKSLKSKLCLLVITFIVWCPTSLCQQPRPDVGAPEGWRKVNAEGLFTFYLPPGAGDPVFKGTDEFYREWRIGRMRFLFVYEPMSRLSYDRRGAVFGSGFKESAVEVGGMKAYLCEYALIEKGRRMYHTELYVGEWPQGEVKLRMQAASARAEDLETARKIFRTVEFPKP